MTQPDTAGHSLEYSQRASRKASTAARLMPIMHAASSRAPRARRHGGAPARGMWRWFACCGPRRCGQTRIRDDTARLIDDGGLQRPATAMAPGSMPDAVGSVRRSPLSASFNP
ncbi:MAG: hypothetical protein KGL63_02865 [Betaproteobacteria bacterium]|nr:hypothetical protein [Betaproteobacteria bacterium]